MVSTEAKGSDGKNRIKISSARKLKQYQPIIPLEIAQTMTIGGLNFGRKSAANTAKQSIEMIKIRSGVIKLLGFGFFLSSVD